jgi:uncharacterized protein YyaL (SSP411 family)
VVNRALERHLQALSFPLAKRYLVATETRTIHWQRDVDAALAEAKKTDRPLLLDFTAAPQ